MNIDNIENEVRWILINNKKYIQNFDFKSLVNKVKSEIENLYKIKLDSIGSDIDKYLCDINYIQLYKYTATEYDFPVCRLMIPSNIVNDILKTILNKNYSEISNKFHSIVPVYDDGKVNDRVCIDSGSVFDAGISSIKILVKDENNKISNISGEGKIITREEAKIRNIILDLYENLCFKCFYILKENIDEKVKADMLELINYIENSKNPQEHIQKLSNDNIDIKKYINKKNAAFSFNN